jgi:hypothetical protein
MANRRPRPDPIISPEKWMVKDAITLSAAVRPLDEANARMEDKWGIDRLPGLVQPDMAARYGQRLEEFERAMDAMDVPAVVDLASRLVKALAHLDRLATEAGHKPLPADSWPAEIDGRRAVVARYREACREIRTEHEVWTIDELARLATIGIQALRSESAIQRIEAAFPGAKIRDARPLADRAMSKELEDDIPF